MSLFQVAEELTLGQGKKLDLLRSATDLFLAEGRLIIESSSELLVWNTAARSHLCCIPPEAHAETEAVRSSDRMKECGIGGEGGWGHTR